MKRPIVCSVQPLTVGPIFVDKARMTINRALLEILDYKGFAKKKHSSLLGFFKDKR